MQPPSDLARPPWLLFIQRHIWVIAGIAGILTLTLIRPFLRHVPEPPPVMFELPDDYALVDHEGQPFTPETLEGKVWVAGFVFTTCPSTCPVVTKAMADLRERFDKMGHDVEMVSFTVDPAHDTPEVLAEYYSTIGVETDKWRFVTGEPKAVISLVRDGFRLGVGEREADEDGVAYDIAHSTKLALVGPDGDVRGYYGIEPDEGLDEIYHRAQHLLREMRVQESER